MILLPFKFNGFFICFPPEDILKNLSASVLRKIQYP